MEPIPDRLVVLTFDDGKKSNATFVAPLLSRHGFGATFFITEGLEFADKSRYMDWAEIKGLHDAGFEIGNHHGSHVDVTTQSGDEFVRDLEQVERSCAAHGIDMPVSTGPTRSACSAPRRGFAGRWPASSVISNRPHTRFWSQAVPRCSGRGPPTAGTWATRLP